VIDIENTPHIILTDSDPEIVETLKTKKAAFPIPPPAIVRKRKERKVTSAAAITDADNPLGGVGDNNGTENGYCSSDSMDG
jgi:hypothetical protein